MNELYDSVQLLNAVSLLSTPRVESERVLIFTLYALLSTLLSLLSHLEYTHPWQVEQRGGDPEGRKFWNLNLWPQVRKVGR